MADEPFDWWNPFDYLDAPREFMTGAVKGVIEGRSIGGILSEGGRAVQGGISFREGIQAPLVRTGRLSPTAPLLGTRGTGSQVTNVVGSMLGPEMLVPAAGQIQGLTKVGKLARTAERIAAAGRRVGLEFTPRNLTRGGFVLDAERAAKHPKLAREIERFNRDLEKLAAKGKEVTPLATKEQWPGGPRVQDPARQVAAGQRRFLGMTGERGAKAREATLGRAAKGIQAVEQMPVAGAPLRFVQEAFDKTTRPMKAAVKGMGYKWGIVRRGEEDELNRVVRGLHSYARRHMDDAQLDEVTRMLAGRYVLDDGTGRVVQLAGDQEEMDRFLDALLAGEALDAPVKAKVLRSTLKGKDPEELIDITPDMVNTVRSASELQNPGYKQFMAVIRNQYAKIRDKEKALDLLKRSRPGYVPTILNPRAKDLLRRQFERMAKINPTVGRVWNQYLQFAKQRSFTDMWDIQSLNEAFATVGGYDAWKEVFSDGSFIRNLIRADPQAFEELAKREKIFVTNPVVALLIRGKASIRATTSQEFINDAVRAWAKPTPKGKKHVLLNNKRAVQEMMDKYPDHVLFVPTHKQFNILKADTIDAKSRAILREAGFVEITKDSLRSIPTIARNIKAHVMPLDVAEELAATHQAMKSPAALSEALSMIGRASNWWKAWTLIGSMAYHTRNGISDLWLAYMNGLRNPAHLVQAARLQWMGARELRRADRYDPGVQAALKAAGDPLPANGLDAMVPGIKSGVPLGTGREILADMRRYGALDTGWEEEVLDLIQTEENLFSRANLRDPNALKARLRQIGSKTVGLRNPWIKAMGHAGRMVSNNVKAALYMSHLDDGLEPWAAAARVREGLYDYRNISQFDRKVRGVIPFWMWTKHNVPKMLELLWTQPEKMVQMARAKTALESGAGPDVEAARQDWIRRNYGVAYRTNKQTGEVEFLFLKNWLPIADLPDIAPGNLLHKVVSDVHPWIKMPFELQQNRKFYTQSDISQFPGQRGEFGLPGGGRLKIPGVLGMDGKQIEYLLRNTLPLRVYRETVESIGANMPGFGREQFTEQRGGLGRRLATFGLGIKTAKVDPDDARRRKMNQISTLRRGALSLYKRQRRQGDEKGAARTLRDYERRARKLQREIR